MGVGGLSREQRKEKLQQLQKEEVETGPLFRQALLQAAARDLEDPAELIKMVCPYNMEDNAAAAGGSSSPLFNIMEPTLASAGLSDVNGATVMMRVLVHEKLLPAIDRGSDCAEYIYELAELLSTMATEAPASTPPLTAHALAELADIAAFFIALKADVPKLEALDGLSGGRKQCQIHHLSLSFPDTFLDCRRSRGEATLCVAADLGTASHSCHQGLGDIHRRRHGQCPQEAPHLQGQSSFAKF